VERRGRKEGEWPHARSGRLPAKQRRVRDLTVVERLEQLSAQSHANVSREAAKGRSWYSGVRVGSGVCLQPDRSRARGRLRLAHGALQRVQRVQRQREGVANLALDSSPAADAPQGSHPCSACLLPQNSPCSACSACSAFCGRRPLLCLPSATETRLAYRAGAGCQGQDEAVRRCCGPSTVHRKLTTQGYRGRLAEFRLDSRLELHSLELQSLEFKLHFHGSSSLLRPGEPPAWSSYDRSSILGLPSPKSKLCSPSEVQLHA